MQTNQTYVPDFQGSNRRTSWTAPTFNVTRFFRILCPDNSLHKPEAQGSSYFFVGFPHSTHIPDPGKILAATATTLDTPFIPALALELHQGWPPKPQAQLRTLSLQNRHETPATMILLSCPSCARASDSDSPAMCPSAKPTARATVH